MRNSNTAQPYIPQWFVYVTGLALSSGSPIFIYFLLNHKGLTANKFDYPRSPQKFCLSTFFSLYGTGYPHESLWLFEQQ